MIDVAEAARLEAGLAGVSFVMGDAYALDFEDGVFDGVRAHQLLQHLSDPVRALAEMRRVLRPAGMLAVRDSDYGAFRWEPRDPLLDRWNELHHQVTSANHAEADAGRFLLDWVKEAGFSEPTAESSTWTFSTAEERSWWGSLRADRVEHSDFALQAIEYGLADRVLLSEIAAAWRRWAASAAGKLIVVHGEILAHR